MADDGIKLTDDEPCNMPHPAYPARLCDRPKGHDAHRRNGDAWITDADAWQSLTAERDDYRTSAKGANDLYAEARRQRDAARAELAAARAELAAANARLERVRALVKERNIYASGIETTDVAGVRFGKLRDVTRILRAALGEDA